MNTLIGEISFIGQLIMPPIKLSSTGYSYVSEALLDTSLPVDLVIGKPIAGGLMKHATSKRDVLKNLNGTKPVATAYDIEVEMSSVKKAVTLYVLKAGGELRIGMPLLRKFGYSKIEFDYTKDEFTLT